MALLIGPVPSGCNLETPRCVGSLTMAQRQSSLVCSLAHGRWGEALLSAQWNLCCLGVRGSTPAPGSDYVRYGGHTSCVAVIADGAAAPTLLMDAGTGIRSLPGLLGPEPFRGSILLSHLHWDHVEGLPFCRAVDRDDARVDLHVPAQDGVSPRDLLARMFSPPSFPIEPEGLLGTWRFLPAPERRHVHRGVRGHRGRHQPQGGTHVGLPSGE